jgi:hypothetical protein
VLVLRPRRLTWVFVLLLSAAFTAGGALMVKSGDPRGWWPFVFFALCAIISSVNLLPGASRLTLTRDGFATTSLYRTSFIPWSHVQVFVAGKVGPNRGVVFDFSPEYSAAARARSFSKALTGAEGALPDTYGLSAERLAAVLNDWRLGIHRLDP